VLAAATRTPGTIWVAENGAGEPGNGDHNDCTAGSCVVPDEEARQASNGPGCQDEQGRAENHGCRKAADRREWADGARQEPHAVFEQRPVHYRIERPSKDCEKADIEDLHKGQQAQG